MHCKLQFAPDRHHSCHEADEQVRDALHAPLEGVGRLLHLQGRAGAARTSSSQLSSLCTGQHRAQLWHQCMAATMLKAAQPAPAAAAAPPWFRCSSRCRWPRRCPAQCLHGRRMGMLSPLYSAAGSLKGRSHTICNPQPYRSTNAACCKWLGCHRSPCTRHDMRAPKRQAAAVQQGGGRVVAAAALGASRLGGGHRLSSEGRLPAVKCMWMAGKTW